MNKTLITLTIALAGAFAAMTSAQAAEADGDAWLQAAKTGKTRVQVNQELQQARTEGTIGFAGTTYKWLPRAKALASRAEVKSEVTHARAEGFRPVGGEAWDGQVATVKRPAAAPRTVAAAAGTQG